MLNVFKNQKDASEILHDQIDLYPEIVATTIDHNKYTFRVTSGTSKSSTTILRIDLTNAKKFALEVEGFNEYTEKNTVKGQVYLLAINESGEEEKHLFAEDEIEIQPIKLNGENKIPDIAVVKAVINEIWQECYIDAMDSTSDEEVQSGPKRKTSKKFGFKSILIIITLVLLAIIAGGMLLSKSKLSPNDSDQKITGMYNQISEQQENKTKEGLKSAEQEALAEFGLKEGVKLD
ncbi:hypothetical protein OFK41_08455 [Acinetobacter baumannii]|uniref:hypothetical protein n=1 Tax=Acinetobacter baumannii TaxID=470 RepID=UPI0022563E85|nr:hypothetical protein [Acinetobacter baumannii]MCX3034238.1 hypothetical protein [Acinetobacter baumannii]